MDSPTQHLLQRGSMSFTAGGSVGLKYYKSFIFTLGQGQIIEKVIDSEMRQFCTLC